MCVFVCVRACVCVCIEDSDADNNYQREKFGIIIYIVLYFVRFT